MGVGIIVRDHMGQVHAASSKTIHSVQEPVVAEAMGALLAAGFSRDLAIQEIEMEGDSLEVVKAIRDPDTQWNSYGHITGDTRWVLNFLRYWTIGHVKRATISAAHGLAKVVVRDNIDMVNSLDEVPLCIYDIVNL